MEKSVKNRIENLLKEECELCHEIAELTKKTEKSVNTDITEDIIKKIGENLGKSAEKSEKIKSIEEEIERIFEKNKISSVK